MVENIIHKRLQVSTEYGKTNSLIGTKDFKCPLSSDIVSFSREL